MGENSKIEWCDHTFNPWLGCTKVSPACEHCYAEALSLRYGRGPYKRGVPRIRTSAANWRKAIAWNKAAVKAGTRPKVFCASLSDWLDDEAPIEWLADLLGLIHATPQLDWLLLTKRPENWRERVESAGLISDPVLSGKLAAWLAGAPRPNVWIGVTVEDQTRADERIPELLEIPAKVRFLSCEPLLGAIDINDYLDPIDGGYVGRSLIDWVIAGGESGPGARPSHPDWFRSLRDQCADALVPFFFKQWGDWGWFQGGCTLRNKEATFVRDGPFNAWMVRVGKKTSGRRLDGREWNEMPACSRSEAKGESSNKPREEIHR